MSTSPSRRTFMIGAGGFAVGTLLTGAAGLTYREYRRSQYIPAPRRTAPAGDDGWQLNENERSEIAALLDASADTSN